MAGEGKLSDIVWTRHPNLYAAAQSTYLTTDDADNINKYAWLVKKHDELIELPTRQRAKAFNALDSGIQELLKNYFETDYAAEENPDTALGKAWNWIKSLPLNPIKGVFTAADAYSRGIGANYTALTARAFESGGKRYSWSEAYDGERLFDEEEEFKIQSILSPEVFNIARRSAMGDSPGEILADLETDAEFEAYERWRSGDEEFKDAIARLKNSKISFGRDFARNVLNLKTDDGLLFKLASGTGDLFWQIVGDPMTYATFGFGKGFQLAGVGIIRGSRAINSVLKGSRNIDELFENPNVRRYWDKAGKVLKDLDSKDVNVSGSAYVQIQKNFSEINNPELLQLLRDDKVFDAAKAQTFFADKQKLEYLLKGKIRPDFAVMPVWAFGKEIRKNLNVAIDKVFYNGEKSAPILKTINEIEDDLIRSGEVFGTPEQLESVSDTVRLAKQRRTVIEKVARAFERAPVVSGIRILEKEVKDAEGNLKMVDEFVESSDDIYKLARTIFNRREANGIRLAFEQATTAERYKMLRGLYVQLGQGMGLTDTLDGRTFLSRVMTTQFDNAYTESVQLTKAEIDNFRKSDPILADAIESNGGWWNPTKTPEGVANAAVHWQVAGQIAVPRFDIWAREARGTKATMARFFGGAVDSKFHDTISQSWTLLTLFPRNGMRGAIDEMLTFGLTAPLTSILSWRKGRALSRAYRVVQGGNESLLLYQRFLRSWFKGKNVTEDEYKVILSDPTGGEFKKAVIRQYGRESSLRFWGKFDAQDAQWIDEGIGTGTFFDNLVYVQGSTTKGFKNSNPNVSLRDENVIGQKALLELSKTQVLEDMQKRAGLSARKTKQGKTLYSTKPEMVSRKTHSLSFDFQWQEQIYMRTLQDPVAARIFLENYKNPTKAIALIKQHLMKDQTIANRLKMRATQPNIDAFDDAALHHFMHLRSVLFGQDGNLLKGIEDNLSKIVVKNKKGKSELNIKWLEENLDTVIKDTPDDLAPAQLLANAYDYIGISKNPGEIVQKMQDGMWGIMDNQTAMMFREPAYFANYLYNRKALKGAQDAMERDLINKGTDPNMAKSLASEHYANLSGKLAMERTVAYIDNPLIRSNTAFMIRNFARFFRATEDFYRRYGRAFRNDPQSLIRLRLATLGLSGSGFIHQTEEGEDYFIIPGDSWMWTVSSNIWKALTGNEILAVNPIEFGVKIQMVSPSLDPDSALPSFAGPLAALPIKAVSAILGTEAFSEVPGVGSGSFKRGFDKYTLGVYSENSGWLEASVPGSVRKMINALNRNERNAQFASAAMQATLYAASNPNIKTPGPDATFMEKQEFLAAIRATAANIIFLRNTLGLVAPAGLSAMETKDVPDYIKEAGFTSMSREFYRMREELNETGEASWSEALLKWTYNEKNTGRLIYTVARTERTGPGEVAKIQTTKEAADWVAGNPKIVNKYPVAAMFFAPQMGEFDIGAYSFLKLNGYIKNKQLDQFLTDINLVEEKRRYFQLGRLYEERIQSTADPGMKSFLRSELENIRRNMRMNNPELDRDLSDYSFSNAKQLDAIDQLDSLLKSGLVDSNPMSKRLALMLERYKQNRVAYNYSILNGLSVEKRRLINIGGLGELEGIAGNDKNLLLALDSLFAPILER